MVEVDNSEEHSLPSLTSHRMPFDDRWKFLTSVHGKVRSSDVLIFTTRDNAMATLAFEVGIRS